MNNDRLDRSGDGYEIVARHNPDFLQSSDSWFRGLELKYGPDGGVYLTDWSDIGECHENDADDSHRENGRIFKITYGDVKPVKVDLAKQSDEELAKLQVHANEWYVRTARGCSRNAPRRARTSGRRIACCARSSRPIATRGTGFARSGRSTPPAGWMRRPCWRCSPTPARRSGPGASGCWSTTVGLGRGHRSARERWPNVPTRHGHVSAERSPLVRLYLASAMQRIPTDAAGRSPRPWPSTCRPRISRNHTLLIWYGLEPLVARDRRRAARLLARCPNPMLCRFIARRMVAADVNAGLAAHCCRPLATRAGPYPSFHREVLDGHPGGRPGPRKRVRMPAGWPETSRQLAERGDAEVRAKLAALGLLFGDPGAESGLRSVVEDRSATPDARQFALRNLVDRRTAGLAALLFRLLDDPELRAPAIRALAAYNDPSTPRPYLKRYAKLSAAERDDAIATLASRPAWALALLDAIRAGSVPRRDVNTTIARQVLAFGDPKLAAALEASWGTLRPTAKDKAPLIARYKGILESGRAAARQSRPRPRPVRADLRPVP